jgi:hypothetical protein
MGRGRERRGRESRSGLVQGLLGNAGSWAILWALGVIPPVAAAWWGLGVAIHAVGVAGKLLASRRPQAALPAPEPVAEPAAAARTPGFLADLDAALAALSRAAAERGLPPGVDLPALRAAAASLHGRAEALAALGGEDDRVRLAAERDAARARAESAADPRTREALHAEAASAEERLAALERAADAAARLASRERTLLHQVEALRVSLLEAGADEGAAPDLAAEVERLRLDVQANAEVDAHLARARLGAAAQARQRT